MLGIRGDTRSCQAIAVFTALCNQIDIILKTQIFITIKETKIMITEASFGGTGKGGKWSVFKITNSNPSQKNKKKSYYYISSIQKTPEDALTRVRAMIKSKTVRGGAKDIAKDLTKDGDDYHDNFRVKKIAKGLSRARAEELRSKLKSKSRTNLVYNTPKKRD